MNKRFKQGLVVGKFSPLHRGHELLIQRALAECAEVILLSYSKPELPGCEAARREHWLSALFPETRRLVVTDERLRDWIPPGVGPRAIPPNEADAAIHRQFCAFLCQHVLGAVVDAVFTSEDYGDGFAAEMTRYFRRYQPGAPAVEHVLVDRQRQEAPVSGTMLRDNIHAHRHWLSPVVYASFVQKVVLLGGESSGKSRLAQALAREFATGCVGEFGRELWEAKSGGLDFANLQRIAEVQVAREELAAFEANRFLFCDTSPLTTLFYCRYLFGKADPSLERLAERKYDFTVLCAPDFAFVQDGTRQDASFRVRQHEWHVRELAARHIDFLLATGPLEQRVQQVRQHLGLEQPTKISSTLER